MNHQAIRNVHPNAIIIKELDGVAEAYDENEDLISIDWDLVKAENTKLINEESALAYSRKRHHEYPAIRDQLDYIYHNGVAKWKTDMIDPVKTKYQKG